MDAIWMTISLIFVFGTVAFVTFAIVRMFGGWHLHHR